MKVASGPFDSNIRKSGRREGVGAVDPDTGNEVHIARSQRRPAPPTRRKKLTDWNPKRFRTAPPADWGTGELGICVCAATDLEKTHGGRLLINRDSGAGDMIHEIIK
jgi:hypothetical protein